MNIVMIVVDCLRADHLSCYGYDKETPNIDNLAKESIQYAKAWAGGSFTSQSLPYLLSEYQYHVLVKHGYIPTVIHSNPILTRYMRKYRLQYTTVDLHKRERPFNRLRNLWDILVHGVYRGEARADEIIEAGIKALNILPEPIFLCLWFMDVHSPYFPPHKTGIRDIILNQKYKKAINNPKIIRKNDLDRLIENYDGEIAYLDSCLLRLFNEIPKDTAIVFTADHGEEFLEDGNLSHKGKNIAALRHVPLLVRTPHCVPRLENSFFDFTYFDKFIEELTRS